MKLVIDRGPSGARFCLACVTIGAALAVYGPWTGASSRDMADVFVVFALPALSVFVQYAVTGVHELGHALAAWAQGLRVEQIKVLNVQWVIHGEAQESNNWGCVFHEYRLARDQPWPATAISLAGPIANLVTAVLAIYLGLAWGGWTLIFTLLLAIASGLSAYRSLIPNPAVGYNDMSMILDFWRDDSQNFAMRSLHRLWPALKGADLRSLEPEDVRRALRLTEPAYRLYAHQIATYGAIATESPEATKYADDYVRCCGETIPVLADEPTRVYAETLVVDAHLERAFARALRSQPDEEDSVEGIQRENWHTARRVYAAEAFAEGDFAAAVERIEAARRAINQDRDEKNAPYLVTAKLFLQILERAIHDASAPGTG